MKKISEKAKIETIYFVSVILSSYFILYLVVNSFPIANWIRWLLTILLGTMFVLLAIFYSDSIFDIFLTEKCKERIGFFVVRWKSEDFDKFVGEELIDLYEDTRKLFDEFETNAKNSLIGANLSDYSFLVLPMAKVYEGVLKRVLVDASIIKEEELLKNPALNVGAYYNPVGNKNIFNHLKDKGRDKVIPYTIYSTYQECRNMIFHYDHYRDNRLTTLDDAQFYVRRIEHAIDKAYETFRK